MYCFSLITSVENQNVDLLNNYDQSYIQIRKNHWLVSSATKLLEY